MKIQTIEQTGKKWKGIQLYGGLGFCIGAIMIFIEGVAVIGLLISLISMLVYFIGRIGAWWHHG